MTSIIGDPADATRGVIDIQELLQRVDGDRDLLLEVARMFLEDVPLLMENVRQSASTRDARALERAAHALKGACANFSAAGAVSAASVLEQSGRRQDLEQLDERLHAVEHEVERLCRALTALVEPSRDPAA
jgi:two-component system sensor histidine kinase/response regulator